MDKSREISKSTAPLSPRKQTIKALADQVAIDRKSWISRNQFYYDDHYKFMRFLTPPNASVLDLGCGVGDLLGALAPKTGVGIDLSHQSIQIAKKSFPDYQFYVGDVETSETLKKLDGPFDLIILSDTIGMLEDIADTLGSIRTLCGPDTRVIVSYYSLLWSPLLKLAERFGLKQRQLPLNWLSSRDIGHLLELSDFEVIKREWRQLVPKYVFGIGPLINRLFSWWPGIRKLCLRNYIVARPVIHEPLTECSVSIVIPCRNERGNIENAVARMPRFAPVMEIIFVEGHSSDDTLQEIDRVIHEYPNWDIHCYVQEGAGKGDAVRKGFAEAKNTLLMILDADLTVAPEALPKFYNAYIQGKGEFVNGSRLIYPLDPNAMRFLNLIANRSFSILFSWLLNQRLTDTLCGTKVLSKENYRKIAENRSYFGDFDPFGDYDLLFGASKLNLKIAEMPIRYGARNYGETQISRFRDGWLLVRMITFAWRKLKAI
tara:strand:+ start:15314 stop:16777 length:1464 start_codon:yes stop_codon:yes gene_type:complete